MFYALYIIKKLLEELDEFSTDSNLEEAADILEVLYSLFAYHNLKLAEIEEVRTRKFENRGGFGKRIILEKVFKA